jgi:hypothetical protein
MFYPVSYDCDLNVPLSYLEQIVNWLKHSPTEMEGYIRPGCIVLSMYLSMAAIAWDEVSLIPGHYEIINSTIIAISHFEFSVM